MPPDSSLPPPTQVEVSIEEAARLLGKSPSTIRRMVKRDALVATTIKTESGFVYRIHLSTEAIPPQPSTLRTLPIDYAAEVRLAVEESLAPLLATLDARDETIRQQAEELGQLRERLAALEGPSVEPGKVSGGNVSSADQVEPPTPGRWQRFVRWWTAGRISG